VREYVHVGVRRRAEDKEREKIEREMTKRRMRGRDNERNKAKIESL
jgi:hypothetical protein